MSKTFQFTSTSTELPERQAFPTHPCPTALVCASEVLSLLAACSPAFILLVNQLCINLTAPALVNVMLLFQRAGLTQASQICIASVRQRASLAGHVVSHFCVIYVLQCDWVSTWIMTREKLLFAHMVEVWLSLLLNRYGTSIYHIQFRVGDLEIRYIISCL